MRKKQVSADVPFSFLNDLGHNTRAMDGFFSLSKNERDILLSRYDTAAFPDKVQETIFEDLVSGGDGYGDDDSKYL